MGNPKAIVFMLDNNLYLHPSLVTPGDHEDLPDNLDHLGNGEGWNSGALPYMVMLAPAAESSCQPCGKGWRQWGCSVCPTAAESCCQPLGLSLQQCWGTLAAGRLLICAERC